MKKKERKRKALPFWLEKQSIQDQNMGMKIVTDMQFQPVFNPHFLNHLLLFKDNKKSVPYPYAAAWEHNMIQVNEREMFKDLLLM